MKGITPVVSVILLLLITISIIGLSMVFFTRTITTTTQTAENQTQTTIGQMSKLIKIENAAGASVTIRHMGTVAIQASELSVFVNGVSTTCTWTGMPLSPNNVATCTLPSSCSGGIVKVSSPTAPATEACS